jgi:hypothetical protein
MKAFCEEIFSDPCDAKDSKKTIMKKISSNITKTEFIYKTKVLPPQIEAGSPMHLQEVLEPLNYKLRSLLNSLSGSLHHRH